jgi:hypothetical protein
VPSSTCAAMDLWMAAATLTYFTRRGGGEEVGKKRVGR